MNTLPAYTAVQAFKPTRNSRQLFKTEDVAIYPKNFFDFFYKAEIVRPLSTTLPLVKLIAMLDTAEHCEGSRYAVVCKQSKGSKYVTTVLDVPTKKLYRAAHPTGMVSYFKGLAKKHPGVITHVDSFKQFVE